MAQEEEGLPFQAGAGWDWSGAGCHVCRLRKIRLCAFSSELVSVCVPALSMFNSPGAVPCHKAQSFICTSSRLPHPTPLRSLQENVFVY